MITEHDCEHIIEYEYDSAEPNNILLKLNEISSKINNSTLRGGGTVIFANPIFETIFMDNDYYHTYSTMLGRFHVEYKKDLTEDGIFLVHEDPSNLPPDYIFLPIVENPPVEEGLDNPIPEITLTLCHASDERAIDYIRKSKGFIRINHINPDVINYYKQLMD